jgi:hypothetical protein
MSGWNGKRYQYFMRVCKGVIRSYTGLSCQGAGRATPVRHWLALSRQPFTMGFSRSQGWMWALFVPAPPGPKA